MLTKIYKSLEGEHNRLILWVPVLMGFGAAGYFHLHDEPPWWMGISLTISFLALSIVIAGSRRRRGGSGATTAFFYLWLTLALMASGFGLRASRSRKYAQTTFILPHSPHR
jgi:hypothetical protein